MSRILSWRWANSVIVLLVILLGVISCGQDLNQLAGGGIGGTGIYTGVISGFGSVFVNGIEFDTTGASITVDSNNTATENDLEIGMKVVIEAVDSTAITILFEPEVKGPIGSVDITNNTLEVLGQTIIVDSTTIFNGLNALGDLQPGNNIEVSGFFDASGNILATFVELESPSLQEVKVKGIVSGHDSSNKTFIINSLTIDYNGVQNPPSFDNGSLVEAKGNLQGNLLIATDIEIETHTPPANSGQSLEVEGIITQVTSTSDFEVNGQRVQTNALTIFKNGTASNIAQNVRVEVKGTVDNNNILIADEVEFRSLENRKIKIEGNAETINTINSTATVFGITITVESTTAFKDESQQGLEPFTLGDVQVGDFLEIGGFIDNSGDVVAVKFERDDDPGYGKESLSGPVDSENPNSSLVILGVTVDVSGTDVQFKDRNDYTIDATTFFNTITQGDIVEVKGDFSGSTFIANKVEIEK